MKTQSEPLTHMSPDGVINDYRIAYRSRAASLSGRREVLAGKATFGIFGDGKEVAQVALARAFRPGDWRSGYYRDQTFMWALDMANLGDFYGQLYGDTFNDPASAGRQMGNHFATRFVDDQGAFRRVAEAHNSGSDVSCLAGWMPRLLGLAYASKLYRQNPELPADGFSVNGDEVAFGMIGDAATSEGLFWETMNAATVLQVPLALSVWDDGYGISVPRELQTATGSISRALSGFASGSGPGLDIHVLKGWDYPALVEGYRAGIERVRREHVPALFHIIEMTQPQGHSTSGSHERYKSKERLEFEVEFDCVARMRAWMIESEIASDRELEAVETEERALVDRTRTESHARYMQPIEAHRARIVSLLQAAAAEAQEVDLAPLVSELQDAQRPTLGLVESAATRALLALRGGSGGARTELVKFVDEFHATNERQYRSHLHSEGPESPLLVPVEAPAYSDASPNLDGRQVLLKCFDANFARDPRIFVAGEDVGKLGDVNLVFEGLNAKYGDLRVTDTGIREATILGQAIGSAMRGLRPICDIQYLDYLLYALQIASDDLANLRWRTAGGQKAPVIIRTKGHRLVGIWHAGSPMAVVLNATRGIHLCVPRNMTQAAGLYNTLLRGDDPAIVIEVLNAYRFKETLPDNVGEFTVPLGVAEILRPGRDVTLVTYGACCRVALDAATWLATAGIEVEIIDVQTLNPFDRDRTIVESVARTHAVVFLDEDVPGGASAYMSQQVLEVQDGWWHLDAAPLTVTASPTRPAYGPDGDYYTKPNRESVIRAVYGLMRERCPAEFAPLD